MTPRQLMAWLELAHRRRQGQLSDLMAVVRVAMNASAKDYAKFAQKLLDESE